MAIFSSRFRLQVYSGLYGNWIVWQKKLDFGAAREPRNTHTIRFLWNISAVVLPSDVQLQIFFAKNVHQGLNFTTTKNAALCAAPPPPKNRAARANLHITTNM